MHTVRIDNNFQVSPLTMLKKYMHQWQT